MLLHDSPEPDTHVCTGGDVTGEGKSANGLCVSSLTSQAPHTAAYDLIPPQRRRTRLWLCRAVQGACSPHEAFSKLPRFGQWLWCLSRSAGPWDYSDKPVMSSHGSQGPLRPAAHSVHRYLPLGPCMWHVVSSSLGCQSMWQIDWCPSSWGSCVQLSPRPGAERHPSQAGAEELIRAACWEADPSSEARLGEMSSEGAPPAHSGPLHDPLQSCSHQVKSA